MTNIADSALPPVLTLAIPTYNRAEDLERLLAGLEPQLSAHPEVDLYLSDNSSSDQTPQILARFLDRGMTIRHHRHPENIGADANFLSCFQAARGKYFWLCSDDEVIVPGGLDLILSHLNPSLPGDELDILYLTSFSFREDPLKEYSADRLHRQHHTFAKAEQLTFYVNINFTFISGVIVNRQRLLALPHEDPSAFLGTNLVQLSWTLPLLQAHRRSRILWTRTLGSRWANSGGYSLGLVFGKNLAHVTARLLPKRPDLAACILNFTLRRWFPSTILGLREAGNASMQLPETPEILKSVFRHNFRYWVFTYPVLKLPLSWAWLWVKTGELMGSIADHARHPLFWRKRT
jgi:glycosyltransferase involved in cell wall biosynthesis